MAKINKETSSELKSGAKNEVNLQPKSTKIVEVKQVKPRAPKMSKITDQDISKVAYQIYLKNGCQPNSEEQNWLQAKAQLSIKE